MCPVAWALEKSFVGSNANYFNIFYDNSDQYLDKKRKHQNLTDCYFWNDVMQWLEMAYAESILITRMRA